MRDSSIRTIALVFFLAFLPFSFYVKKRILEIPGFVESFPTGQKFESFRLRDLDGGSYEFDELIHGQKITLLHFWASWCTPCKEEMPSLVMLHDKYHEKGFKIIAVSVDQDERALRQYLTDTPLPFPIYLDPENALMERYGLSGIPVSVFLDSHHKVISSTTGTLGYFTDAWIEAWLKR